MHYEKIEYIIEENFLILGEIRDVFRILCDEVSQDNIALQASNLRFLLKLGSTFYEPMGEYAERYGLLDQRLETLYKLYKLYNCHPQILPNNSFESWVDYYRRECEHDRIENEIYEHMCGLVFDHMSTTMKSEMDAYRERIRSADRLNTEILAINTENFTESELMKVVVAHQMAKDGSFPVPSCLGDFDVDDLFRCINRPTYSDDLWQMNLVTLANGFGLSYDEMINHISCCLSAEAERLFFLYHRSLLREMIFNGGEIQKVTRPVYEMILMYNTVYEHIIKIEADYYTLGDKSEVKW